ncbi:MAG: nucleotidyltransferase domain-containing protein [Candidatus Pacearchaeota archaeon]|jgi:predicted nucleotidyltransferase
METKLKIITELEKKPKGVHLRELSRLVKTGLPNVKRFIDILEKEKVIRKQKEANLLKLYLREGQTTLAYLKQTNNEKFNLLPVKVQNALIEFLDELEIKPLITLIFGSYVKGNYNIQSDIDVLLVFQKLENVKEIENTARRISMRTGTKISPIYLEYKNFEKNFLDKNHDFSKEIRQDVIIINGGEFFYSLLWRFLS